MEDSQRVVQVAKVDRCIWCQKRNHHRITTTSGERFYYEGKRPTVGQLLIFSKHEVEFVGSSNPETRGNIHRRQLK